MHSLKQEARQGESAVQIPGLPASCDSRSGTEQEIRAFTSARRASQVRKIFLHFPLAFFWQPVKMPPSSSLTGLDFDSGGESFLRGFPIPHLPGDRCPNLLATVLAATCSQCVAPDAS